MAGARFYASRVQLAADGSSAHIRGVVPPDGRAGVVDDSVYTNGLAVLCLRHAASAARLLGGAVAVPSVDAATIERWEALSAAIVLPVDPSLADGGGEAVHPEFADYAGQRVQQADAVLLGHPLGLYGALSGREDGEAQRRAGAADVGYYGARYDAVEGVGALTWGMQAVNLLDVGKFDARKCYMPVVGI